MANEEQLSPEEQIQRLELELTVSPEQFAASQQQAFVDQNTGLGPSQLQQATEAEAALTPEQRELAQRASSERGKPIVEFLIPGYEDLATGGALSLAKTVGQNLPVARPIKLAVQAGTAILGKQALDAAPELFSQAGNALVDVGAGALEGAKDYLMSPSNNPGGFAEPFMKGVQKGAEDVDLGKIVEASGITDPLSVGAETAALGAGKAVEYVGGKAVQGISKVFDAQRRLKKAYADKAIKALGIDRGKLSKFNIRDGVAEPELYESLIRIADDGVIVTQSPDRVMGTLATRQEQIGQQLHAMLEEASIKKLPASSGPVSRLQDAVRQKVKQIKLELAANGKENWLNDVDAAAQWVDDQIWFAAEARGREGLSTPISLNTLNSIKTQIYKGARYGSNNPSESALFVDRQMGRAIKEAIEDFVDDPNLKKLNTLYGDYEEAQDAIGGRLASYIRGEQMSFSAQMQNTMGTAAIGLLAAQNLENPELVRTMITLGFGAMAVKAATTTPGFRRQLANMSLSLANGGLPIQVANAYAGQRLMEGLVSNAMATPIPRDSTQRMDIEMAAPRIVSQLLEAGAPPEMAMQEGMMLAQGLASESPVTRQIALRQLSTMLPSALDKSASGYNVLDEKFLLPEEQSHYIQNRLAATKGDIKAEADAMEAGLNGRYQSNGSEARVVRTQEQPSPLPTIDMDYLDGSFQSAQAPMTPMGSSPVPSGDDLISKLKSLSAGTDKVAY